MSYKTFLLLSCSLAILSACAYLEAPSTQVCNVKPRRTEVQSQSIREGFLSVSGGNIWYRMVGIGQPGIPLLVIHGGPGASHDYLGNLEAFSRDRPVVFYDQLGCGRSDRTDDKAFWTLEHNVLELQQIRDALNLPKVHILAHSFGTMVGTEYVLKEPSGLMSLVLSGPILSVKRFAADAQALIDRLPLQHRKSIDKAEYNGDFSSKDYENAVDLYRHQHICRLNPWPEFLQHTMQNKNLSLFEYMWGPSDFRAKGTLKDYDAIAKLHKIQIPVLLSCGEFDQVPPKTCAFYSKHIPNVEVVAFGEASHNHHLEKIDSYLLTIRRFIGKAEKRGH